MMINFVVVQGDESMSAEKLRQLHVNSNNTSRNLLSGKELKDVPSANQSLVCLCFLMHGVVYLKLICSIIMFWLSWICIVVDVPDTDQLASFSVTDSVVCPCPTIA